MAWQEQRDLVTDCYYSLTIVSGFSTKNKESIKCPSLSPTMRPVLHDDSLPVPRPPGTWWIEGSHEDTIMYKPELGIDTDPDFEPLACSESYSSLS